jgi:dihydropteroate synthase
MGILNVTPDSFSDGANYFSVDEALRHAELLISHGAAIIDIGGESTRPNSQKVSEEEEVRRVVPVIESLAKNFDVPISIDTSKSEVATRAVDAGAEIINDVSGLRFDEKIAEIAAEFQAGLVLMHLRGSFETMHRQEPVVEILEEVSKGFRYSLMKAHTAGVPHENIVLDVGIGFSKTFEQNQELLANLDELTERFSRYPILVGTSRKSFLGKILDDAPSGKRLSGSLASAAVAVWNGARIVRAHDVRETVEAVRVVDAIKLERKL